MHTQCASVWIIPQAFIDISKMLLVRRAADAISTAELNICVDEKFREENQTQPLTFKFKKVDVKFDQVDRFYSIQFFAVFYIYLFIYSWFRWQMTEGIILLLFIVISYFLLFTQAEHSMCS